MTKRKSEDIESIFQLTQEKVSKLLSKYKFIELLEGKLYFVNKEGAIMLSVLQSKLENELATNSERKRYNFGLIAKFLNPKNPATRYFIGIKGRHRQINDETKVNENLEGEFAIWKNKVRKEASDYATLHSLDDEALALLEQKIERQINEAQGRYEFIKENRESLEVRIVGYEHEKSFPYVAYTVDKKMRNTHVSTKVPTILYYEPVKFRSDMSVAEFTKQGINAFGDVYFMEKQ